MLVDNRKSLYAAILLAVVFSLYGNTLFNGFVWDDRSVVVNNRDIKDFSVKKIVLASVSGLEYLPLRDLSYAVDYALWGDRATGFHLTNLLLFLVNVILVYLLAGETLHLLRRKGEEPRKWEIPFSVALLFAVHPIQSQAVNFITCRNVLLSGAFFFSAIIIWLRSYDPVGEKRVVICWWGLVCFVCALLCKATTIILPLLLLLYTLLGERDGLRKRLLGLVPYFFAALVFFFIHRHFALKANLIATGQGASDSAGIVATLTIALQIPFFYLKMLLLPAGFSAEYDVHFAVSPVAPQVMAALSLLLVSIAVAIPGRLKNRPMVFSFGWFLIALVPVLNIFPTTPLVADRYVFIPIFGFLLLIVATLSDIADRFNRKALLYPIIMVAAGLAVVTFSQNRVWKDDRSLWEAAVRNSPGQPKGYTNLGWAYFHAGEYEKGIEVFKQQQKLFPGDYNLELARGYYHFKRQEWREAVGWFDKVLIKKDDSLYALYLSGRSYVEMGDYAQAVNAFNRILISREPDFSGYRDTARKNLEWLRMQSHSSSRQGR